MKFSCIQNNLFSGLSLVARVAGRGVNLPILGNVLLRTTKTGLELTTTNLEVAIIVLVRGKVEIDGAVTVNAKLLSEAVGILPNERVDIELMGVNLTLRCGKHRTTVRGTSVDDFPVIPQVVGGETIILPAKQLSQAFTKVSFAVNQDDSRPELAGVLLKTNQNEVVVVGTDGYRLAEQIIAGLNGVGVHELIVPLRAVHEIIYSLEHGEAEFVEVVVGESQVVWNIGGVRITSRLVAGQYPDYKQIIPQNVSTVMVIGREELVRAVRAASLFVRSGINDVRLVYQPNESIITISSTNSQLGENQTEITTHQASGDSGEIVFNFHYLLEGLQVVSADEVELGVVNMASLGVLRAVSDTSYTYIIKPIKQ